MPQLQRLTHMQINLFNLQPYATYGEGSKWTGAISTGWGGNDTNAYFLLMISSSACGGTVKNYSKRFTISSMTGSFPPNVMQGIQSIEGDASGPANDQSAAGPALSCTASVAPEPVSSPTMTSAATATTIAHPTATPAAQSPSNTISTSSKSITLSTGALAGIIVVSMLIFATISGVAVFTFLRLRRRRMQPQSPKSNFKSWLKRDRGMEKLNSTDHLAELSETALCKEMDGDKRQPTELSTIVRAELPARRSIYELPGS